MVTNQLTLQKTPGDAGHKLLGLAKTTHRSGRSAVRTENREGQDWCDVLTLLLSCKSENLADWFLNSVGFLKNGGFFHSGWFTRVTPILGDLSATWWQEYPGNGGLLAQLTYRQMTCSNRVDAHLRTVHFFGTWTIWAFLCHFRDLSILVNRHLQEASTKPLLIIVWCWTVRRCPMGCSNISGWSVARWETWEPEARFGLMFGGIRFFGEATGGERIWLYMYFCYTYVYICM